MQPDWNEIGARVIASLEPTTRTRAAVYLSPKVYESGDPIEAGRETLVASEPSVLAFVDLEPHLNWSHACRYLVCGIRSGSCRTVPAQFPPAADRLRLVHRGKAVEDWMLLTREPLSAE